MAEAVAPAVSASSAAGAVSAGYRRYALVVLMGTYTLCFLDRRIIEILAEHIKRELHLADWQLGMMTGPAFAIFYALIGVPIARLAERKNRAAIISVCMAVWSAFTMACGLAGSFITLLLARIGVGAGEAGCFPPAYSLIGDYADRTKRASAIGFFSLGAPFGTLAGMLVGGFMVEPYGWRVAMMVAGAPGILLALIAAFTLREPRRGQPKAESDSPTFRETLKALSGKRTFWLVVAGVTIKGFAASGVSAFATPFILRNHGIELGAIAQGMGMATMGLLSLVMALSSMILGSFGTLLGGHLGDRIGSKDVRALCRIPAVAAFVAVPFYCWALLAQHPILAIAMFAVPQMLNGMSFGPLGATTVSVVEPRMRATAMAIQGLVNNLLGLGLGPLVVGALSDTLAGPLGLGEATGVRWAMISASVFSLVAAGLYWFAGRSVAKDVAS